MRSILLTAALLLACGAASAQTASNSEPTAGPVPPTWVLERWTRDITRISAELVTSAERLPQCSSLQAKQQLQRARLMAESMRKTDRTPMGEFSDATLHMTSVVNNVRLALDACQP